MYHTNIKISGTPFRSQGTHEIVHKVPKKHPNGIMVDIKSHPKPIAPSCNAEPAIVAQVVAGA